MQPAGAALVSRPIRMTIADKATEQLRSLILSGELADGSPLRQDALAEELGVSRIPIREALSRLEGEGLVASFPHRGYVVTALSREEILELFDLRLLLEPGLMLAATPRMREHDLLDAFAILEEYDAEFHQATVHRWGELNTRYHMALYAPSGRTRTLEIVRGLLVNTDRYTRMVLTLGNGVGQAREDHGSMLDLLRRGSANQAAALIRDHIERARSDLLALLDEQPAVLVPYDLDQTNPDARRLKR